RCIDHEARASFLTDRRTSRPYGVAGGEPGERGENVLIRNGMEIGLPAKGTTFVLPGDTISIRSPGGGGYGNPAERSSEARGQDVREGRV
ncbi:hydantoinase B/oxoprolinase family protein, partial [Candidatus Bipolaricaulota bacterium]